MERFYVLNSGERWECRPLSLEGFALYLANFPWLRLHRVFEQEEAASLESHRLNNLLMRQLLADVA